MQEVCLAVSFVHAVCCSMIQCVAVCCSVLQCVAVWCSVSSRGDKSAADCSAMQMSDSYSHWIGCMQCVAVRCSVLRCNALSATDLAPLLDTLQHTVSYCNALQHTACSQTHCHLCLTAASQTAWQHIWHHWQPHCNTATYCNPATHCNILQHNATHYKTLRVANPMAVAVGKLHLRPLGSRFGVADRHGQELDVSRSLAQRLLFQRHAVWEHILSLS